VKRPRSLPGIYTVVELGLSFSEKKIIPRNTEQTEMSKFHLFCGMEYARIPVRASLRKRKKAQNSVPKHFVEEKILRTS
jgi:hypothetical protein